MANTYVYFEQGGAGTLGAASGYVDCDGSTLVQVECGFVPSAIRAYVIDDPNGTPLPLASYDWHAQLDDSDPPVALEQARKTDSGVDSLTAVIKRFAGSPASGSTAAIERGFTLEATEVANGDRFCWVAFR